ncbi:MAG: lipoyl(octanoyl) transferase LipB [Actinobacteria bacterium]|nr:lipoyl(octanoyl) transferase LipB [Actinomycetota bacterium]
MFNDEHRTRGPSLSAAYLGRVEFEDAWALQHKLFRARTYGEGGDSLLLLEHPPVYTLGRRTKASDLVWDEAARRARSISVCEVDRGGRATYHGPGQLVGYPIMALGERYDVIGYLRRLEEVLILTAADLGVGASRDNHTGVWVGPNKLAALGVKITRGITMHGFALNVTTDLTMFEGIVPCGIKDRWVTSIEAETGTTQSVGDVAAIVAGHTSQVFGRPLKWVDPDRMGVGHPPSVVASSA